MLSINGFILTRRHLSIINKAWDFNSDISSLSHFDAEVIGRCGEQSHCASGEILQQLFTKTD